jgi:zinc/manganese transport system permease protein
MPDVLFDPLFALPFVNGALVAVLLPLLGAYARLREEWLASLGIAQVAAAGVVVASFVSAAVVVVALVAAVLAAAVKSLAGRSGNDAYALMILLGWSAALIAAANLPRGEDLARALVEGQLYFTGLDHLQGLLVATVVVGVLLPRISASLLLGRFFPDHFRANGRVRPQHDLVFDVLLAACLALAATAVGVMAAFALVFAPAWVAFRFAHGWRRTLAWSAALGAAAYTVSFAMAIVFDQPYGPVLVAVLLAVVAVRPLTRRHTS